MSHKDRKQLGKAGMTAMDAIEIKEARDEAELQKWCGQLLTQRGIEFINPPMRKRSQLPPGWPDFTFSYLGKSCAWECKTAEGKLSPDQEDRIKALRARPNFWAVEVITNLAQARDFLERQSNAY